MGKTPYTKSRTLPSTLAVLPFLELSIESFKERVSEFLQQRSGLSFPYEIVVQAGFEHGSPHWTDCSLQWLSGLSGALDADFTEDLKKVVSNTKRYSQQSRHLARQLIKREYHK